MLVNGVPKTTTMIVTCPKCGSTDISRCGGNMSRCGNCNNVFFDNSNNWTRMEVSLTVFIIVLCLVVIIWT